MSMNIPMSLMLGVPVFNSEDTAKRSTPEPARKKRDKPVLCLACNTRFNPESHLCAHTPCPAGFGRKEANDASL